MNLKLFKVNIQLFADKDDKTEKPTVKRRRDSREEGQVLQSREINSALLITIAFASLKWIGQYVYMTLEDYIKKVFIHYTVQDDLLSEGNYFLFIGESLWVLFKLIIPLMTVTLIVGLIVSYAQVGFLFTVKTLKPKLSKLNPINGIKRLFSTQALAELFKAIFKIAIVGYIAYICAKKEIADMLLLLDREVGEITVYICNIIFNIALKIGSTLILLAAVDYFFQWRRHEKELMMTKQEVKEEYKQIEGNPQIKSKIKQKQREFSLRRMMTEVPKADVIITNPTHLAVALKYDADIADAPIVIAKGQNYIAFRIKQVANDHSIEIVENKPLARALYESTEIGSQVPSELFQAVAEVLAFVYNLRNKAV